MITISPLIAPSYIDVELPLPVAGMLLLTSQTAVEAARRLIVKGATLPERALCVGKATAEAAAALGMTAVSADGDADALVRLVQEQDFAGPFLHLHGEDVVGNIAQRLNSAGLETFSLCCYTQVPQPLTAQALDLLRADGPVVVPLFSPRTAQLFAQQCASLEPIAPLFVAALSKAVAEGLAPMRPHRLDLAAAPDAAAMVATTAALFAAASPA